MPIYEYRCGDCGHAFEKLQKLNEQPLIDCPECGQAALQKLISAAGFRLKGKGWYETDFKNSKKESSSTKQDKQDKKSDKTPKATESSGTGTKAASTD